MITNLTEFVAPLRPLPPVAAGVDVMAAALRDESWARVACGAAWFDVERPSWFTEVDLLALDMDDPGRCVLGQVYGAWYKAPGLTLGTAVEYGFLTDTQGWTLYTGVRGDLRYLEQAWRTAIAQRLTAQVIAEHRSPVDYAGEYADVVDRELAAMLALDYAREDCCVATDDDRLTCHTHRAWMWDCWASSCHVNPVTGHGICKPCARPFMNCPHRDEYAATLRPGWVIT